MKISNKFFAHESCYIDENVIIGDNTKIWHFSHIQSGAKIGYATTIGQNVNISNNVIVGNNVKIQNNVSIYEGVELEDFVFCGPSMVFTNVLNPRAEVCRRSEYKTTLIKQGATLGANSTIICGVCVGQYAFIGAGAVVTRDIKDFALMVGVPARQIGWMSAYGERIELPKKGRSVWVCSHTNDIYELNNNHLAKNDLYDEAYDMIGYMQSKIASELE